MILHVLRKRTKRCREKKLKRDTAEILNALYEGREMTLNAFKSGTHPLQATEEVIQICQFA